MKDQKTASNFALLQAMHEIQELCYDALDTEVMKDDEEKSTGLEAISFLSQQIYEYSKGIKAENLEYRYERNTKKMLGIPVVPSLKDPILETDKGEIA